MDFSKTYNNYYLDLDQVLKLDNETLKHVINLYENAILHFNTESNKSGNSFFKTLYVSGYIKNFDDFDRNNKIEEILNKDEKNDD
jgi:hypothetical protein